MSLPDQSLSELDKFLSERSRTQLVHVIQHWCCQNGVRCFPTDFLARATNVTMTVF